MWKEQSTRTSEPLYTDISGTSDYKPEHQRRNRGQQGYRRRGRGHAGNNRYQKRKDNREGLSTRPKIWQQTDRGGDRRVESTMPPPPPTSAPSSLTSMSLLAYDGACGPLTLNPLHTIPSASGRVATITEQLTNIATTSTTSLFRETWHTVEGQRQVGLSQVMEHTRRDDETQIINLLSFQLSPKHVCVLKKGLTFTPTSHNII